MTIQSQEQQGGTPSGGAQTLHTLRIKWLWIGASAFGAWAGTIIALFLFPSASFGRNPTGLFSWSLLGFALAIGILPGTFQWLVFRDIAKSREIVRASFLVLWIPVTTIGVTVMILPLWWVSAEAISMTTGGAALVPMLPGAVLLGVAQWLLLHWVMRVRWTWIRQTIFGAWMGSGLGLLYALGYSSLFRGSVQLALFSPFISVEPIWALVTGANIAALQTIALLNALNTDLTRGWNQG
jgi:hypothetical protein